MGRKLPIYHFDADSTTDHRSEVEDIRATLTKNELVLLCYIVTYKKKKVHKFRLQSFGTSER